MAEEVVQKLGLDASQAIQALRTLSAAFSAYARNVQAAAIANTTFTKSGRDFLSALAADARTVAQFTKDLAALTRAQEQQANAAARAAAAEARAAAQRQQQGRAIKLQKELQPELTGGIGGGSLQRANELVVRLSQIGAKANLSAQQIRSIGRNLDKAFVGPQGQIAGILRELNALSNAPNPGPKIQTGFIGAVVTANLLSNAISAVKRAMSEGIQEAIQYEKTLARIQTIAGGDAGNINLLSKNIRALADEFGQPVAQVAAAQYELLSNQIGDVTSSADVLREALKLANVTGADVPDTVNAISSVLNSYNLTTQEAADVSAKLFRAVDLGRFTLDEVANSLGRVTVVASQTGVSFDEILAALSTLTITGLKADEAMTLLGNAIRGLLKPTDATKEAMRQIGVQSAEAGIRAFGFLGFLEKITETAGDSATEITQLTDNIRVARGFLGLTGQQADRAAENLRKLQNTSAETLDIKNQLIIQTNAKQVEKELESVKNFFIEDLGRGALQTIAEISNAFGGLSNVVKGAAAALGVAAGVFLTIKAQALAASIGVAGFNAAIAASGPALLSLGAAAGTFAALLLPVAALVTAVNSLGKEFSNTKKNIDEATSAANNLIDVQSKQAAAEAKKTADFQRAEHQKRMSEIAQFTAELGRLNNIDRESALRTTKSITTFLQDQLKERISAYEKYVDALANANAEHEKNVQQSNQRITDLQDAANSARFNRQVSGLPELQAQTARLNRVQELLNKAQRAESQGLEGQRRADRLREEAASLAEQAASIAQASKNRAQLMQAERAIDRVLNAQISAERQRQELSAATAKQAQERLAKEQINLAQIKDLESRIREIQSKALTEKDLTNEQRVDLLRKAVPLAEELRKKLEQAGDPDLARKLGLGNLTDEIRKPLIDALGQPTNVKLQFEGAAELLAKELNSADIKVRVTPVIDAIKTIGVDIEKILAQGGDPVRALESQQSVLDEQVKSGIKASEDLSLKQAAAEKAINTTSGAVAKLRTEMFALAKGVDTDAGTITQALQNISSNVAGPGLLAAIGLPTQRFKSIAEETGALEQRISEAIQQMKTDIGSADISGLINELNQKALAALNSGDANLSRAFTDVAESLQAAFEKLREVAGSQAQIDIGNAAASQLETLRQAIQFVGQSAGEAQAAQNAFNSAMQGTASAATTSTQAINTETQAVRQNTAALRENAAARAAAAAAGAQGKALGGLVTYRASGGPVYFAGGGAVPPSVFKPRGTDTVPAMLSPGEFVVNAQATRKFFSQLVAINAGRQPTFRSEGGSVTNVSIGDIVVNSQGGSSIVGRDIARALNRELRRGNIRLK